MVKEKIEPQLAKIMEENKSTGTMSDHSGSRQPSKKASNQNVQSASFFMNQHNKDDDMDCDFDEANN